MIKVSDCRNCVCGSCRGLQLCARVFADDSILWRGEVIGPSFWALAGGKTRGRIPQSASISFINGHVISTGWRLCPKSRLVGCVLVSNLMQKPKTGSTDTGGLRCDMAPRSCLHHRHYHASSCERCPLIPVQHPASIPTLSLERCALSGAVLSPSQTAPS